MALRLPGLQSRDNVVCRPGKAQPPPGKKNGTASSPGKVQPLPGKKRHSK
ncbi:hypothetical protein HMPREF1619_05876 [Klebsiella pneumoniae 909957]|nr:hypothetical protein HMPREF1619_05876 [Klebsiella pneumoniae 909957]